MKGAWPCGLVFLQGEVERDLRAHIAAKHPDAFHDADGRIVVERYTDRRRAWEANVRKAWEAINRGVPVLMS